MTLQDRCAQRLRDIYLELEACTDEGMVAYAFSLAALEEVRELLLFVLTSVNEAGLSPTRILYLTKILESAKQQIEAGGIQEGLWFGKKVITYYLQENPLQNSPM